MKITMLGTGNALVTKCYNTCFVLTEGQKNLLVDAGGGNQILSRLQEAGIPLSSIHDLILTHAHTDHILGVIWVLRIAAQSMAKGKFDGTLTVYGHRECLAVLRQICDLLLGKKQLKYFDDRILFSVVEDGEAREIAGLSVEFFDIHSDKLKQFGFRAVTKDGKVLSCMGDEPCQAECAPYAKGADLLMTEAFCLYEDREIHHPYEKSHSTALDAAKLAETLGVSALLLYHTEDDTYENRKTRYTAEAKMAFSGPVFVPYDLETLEL